MNRKPDMLIFISHKYADEEPVAVFMSHTQIKYHHLTSNQI